MTEENTRILKLFYAIIGSSGFVKAGELAGLLQTSERTVKSSMEELKTFACQKGLTWRASWPLVWRNLRAISRMKRKSGGLAS